jgi:hypothetical protein
VKDIDFIVICIAEISNKLQYFGFGNVKNKESVHTWANGTGYASRC